MKTVNRMAGVLWGDDNTAVAYDRWWPTRNSKTYVFSPSNSTAAPRIIDDRNYQDQYSDPGNFVTKRNKLGRSVLAMDGDNAYLLGAGYSKEGQFPFLHQFTSRRRRKRKLYRSTYTDKLENLNDFDPATGRLLVRIESSTDYPNYYFRELKKDGELTQLTNFANPYKALADVHKEVITYQRDDGLELSGTLHLPVGYDMEKKEKMPMILWAYPPGIQG
jgi:dipeptidyl aminopeptidase/acylaminoacyl peptidase